MPCYYDHLRLNKGAPDSEADEIQESGVRTLANPAEARQKHITEDTLFGEPTPFLRPAE